MKTLRNLFYFYIDGFKNMKLGKTLWKIIAIKLLLIFLLLNYFVYDKSMKTEYKTPEEKAQFVYENLKGK
jgi:hypothetical protein